jgi:hypothetical protein
LAAALAEVIEMTVGSLQHRLQNLEGVAAIELDLADAGLAGIKVTLNEGADETQVLERIRSLLVTYGLRSQPGLPVQSPSPIVARPPDAIWTKITPEGDGMRVEVGRGRRRVSRLAAAEPMAAAQAVVDARCELEGRQSPKVVYLGLDRVGEHRVLTVIVGGDHATPEVGAAMVTDGWAAALGKAVDRTLHR